MEHIVESKRILFIIRSYRPDQVGGGAKSVQSLAEGLAARGHDVHVLRLAPKGKVAHYHQLALEAGISGVGKPQLHIMPIRNVYWPYGKEKHSRIAKAAWHAVDLFNLRSARDLRKFLRELRPDIVNTSIIDGFSPSILPEVARSGAKLIHTMRDYYLICSRSGMFRNGANCQNLCHSCRLVQLINRPRTRSVDLFLSNSAFVANTHKRLGGISHTTPCAVQKNVNDRPLAFSARNLADDEIVFGYIGTLWPTKGVEKFIEAAAQLNGNGRNWSIVIAGDGPSDYVRQLKELAKGLANVTFLGWTTPETFYPQVDVVVCPSVYNEPLPRVIYEAYGFALPVIASSVGGNPEIIIEGSSGELYEGHDAAALARCMQMFREMHRARYREYSESALRLGSTFTPDAVLDSFESHISYVCAEPAKRTNADGEL